MALSLREKNIVETSSIGSLGASAMLMGYCFFVNQNTTVLQASTGAMAFGVSAYAVGHLYDVMGQKLVAWKALQLSAKTVKVSTASDIENLTSKLQGLEHAIDHRINVISDSSSQNAQVALGAWVHAAKSMLAKAKLFDVAESPVDRDITKLSSHWPVVEQQLQMRIFGYQRMLRLVSAQEVSDTIINTDPAI